MPKDSSQPLSFNIGLVKARQIEHEMQESYLDYAMSVIVSRALPDVRDGLKPVHRRILYVMHELGLRHNVKFRKSAAVVGDVLGKYHPHGDIAVYDSMVHMAQTFAMRYPLIDGQGNFGCFTGDTQVALADGRNLNFNQLIQEYKAGKTNFTYTFNNQTKAVEIAEIKHPRLTKKQAELVEVKLDNGEKIRCTPNHKFMLRDGSYCEAQFLTAGQSLMPLNFRLSSKTDDPHSVGYRMVWQPKKQVWSWAHHLADLWNLQKGIYKNSAGRVRHHLDFNKLNNSPDNIQRMQWGDHFKLHSKLASKRHEDPEYRAKIKSGRDKYWSETENKKKRAVQMSDRNKISWQDPKYRAKHSKMIKELWKNPEFKTKISAAASKNLQKLWQTEKFKQLLRGLKSKELKARWQDPKYREEVAKTTRAMSLKLWSQSEHRQLISRLMKEKWNNPAYKAKRAQISKNLWENPEYRSHYANGHFSKMAKILWANPNTQKLHKEKGGRQWRDPKFRKTIIEGITIRNHERLKANPNLMKELAAKASVSLSQKWQDPLYKEKVVKSKILGFVNKLMLLNSSPITPEVYDEKRTPNGVPRLTKALGYFANFQEMVEQAKIYNHKIVGVKLLAEREDVFDLTVDITHNFALASGIIVHNSMDGDGAAAMRYTEARMSALAEELLTDLDKETVDWRDNYDATRKEPVVLPGKVPNLLLNGTLGIAVGMATDIPPHNLTEVCDAIIKLIDDPEATTEDLMEFIKGPDFPTGGIIYDIAAIKNAYATGKGGIVMRGKTEITETKTGAFQILIHEIPYRVNKATLLEKIAELVRDKKIEGIKDVRDESDKDGVRIVVDIKKDGLANKILNQLFSYTQLQETFHLNMLALVDGIEPHVLNLKTVLEKYLEHRQVVVKRRTAFELKKAKERAHILEGLKKALDHIDEVINTIRKSPTKEEAHANLMKKFKLTDIQSSAILEMRLQTLAGLERKKIEDELKEKKALIEELEGILQSAKKILAIIKKEVEELKAKFGDERRTQVIKNAIGSFSAEDLIPESNVIITVTKSGYVKRLAPDTYKAQSRGGKGVIGQSLKEEDVVDKLISSNTHDDILFFTNKGRVFQTKVYELPEGSRTAKGQALVNFLQLQNNETAQAVLTFSKKDGAKFLVMSTKKGLIKKVAREEFEKVRKSGMIAINLKGDDELKWVEISSGDDQVMLSTENGQAIRFSEKDVRPMGRNASGVSGMRIKKDDHIISMDIIRKEVDVKTLEVLVVTENGLGKKTEAQFYKVQKRGGSGIKTLKVTSKTGKIVAMYILNNAEEHDLVIISKMGQTIRTPLNKVSTLGRATQGVRVMRLDEGDKVASATII